MTPLLPKVPVHSTNLEAVGYDPQTAHLQVTFQSGPTYDYFGVPPQAYQGLLAAKSKSHFLSTLIKPRFRHAPRQAR